MILKKYPAKVSLRGSVVSMNYRSLLRSSFPVYFFSLGLETLDFFFEDCSAGLADLVGEVSFYSVSPSGSSIVSGAFSVSLCALTASGGTAVFSPSTES